VASYDGGKKYAASQLHVDADVTADVDSLLSGVHRTAARDACYRAGMLHRDTNDEPAAVFRTRDTVTKTWFRDGKPWNGCLGKYSHAGYTPGERPWVTTFTRCGNVAAHVEDDETAALVELLERREPFER
jgi:hypothetical protein